MAIAALLCVKPWQNLIFFRKGEDDEAISPDGRSIVRKMGSVTPIEAGLTDGQKSLPKGAGSGILRSSKARLNLQQFAETDLKRQTTKQPQKGIQSFRKRIAEHEAKIQNPGAFDVGWSDKSAAGQSGLLKHWKKEISAFSKNIKNREEELKRR